MATEHNEQAQDQTVDQEQGLENTETNENAEEVKPVPPMQFTNLKRSKNVSNVKLTQRKSLL